MILSWLFHRARRIRQSKTANTMPIIVRRSIYNDTDHKKVVSALIDEYVNPLMHRGEYLRSELPTNALRAYHTDYYMAQVVNGGHKQFRHNSGMDPLVIQDVREGLAAIGIEPYITIFRDFEEFAKTLSKRAEVTPEKSGLVESNPLEAELDKRFYQLDCYETLMPANGRWVKSWPQLSLLSDAKFSRALQTLVDQNPRANARRANRIRERLARRLHDPLQVAARLLGYKHDILPIATGGGFPAAKAPGGRSAMGWGWLVYSEVGEFDQFMMFLGKDVAILCEAYLPDGRKITRALRAEIWASLSGDILKRSAFADYGQKTFHEVCSVPALLVAEAVQLAKDFPILTAAELICEQTMDQLKDIYALTKKQDGSWLWCTEAKGGKYMMVMLPDRLVVSTMDGDASKRGVPMVFHMDDLRRIAEQQAASQT